MISKEKELENKKKRLRAYANLLGLQDYNIVFIKKDSEKKHTTETINGIEKADFYINRIYDSYKINPRSKYRSQNIVMTRQALIYILYKKGVNKFALSKAFDQNHSTTIYTIQKVKDWLEVNDPTFIGIYNDLFNFTNELDNYANI